MTNCIPTKLTRTSGWQFYLSEYVPEDEKTRETIFALGNGVLMSRAATLESDISERHYPGTYGAACYERLRSHVAGQVDETESLANLPNWLSLRLRLGDEQWFSLDSAELLAYRHGLDVRAGIAWREWTIRSGANRLSKAREERLMSMAQPQLAAVAVQITPLNWSADVEVCSAIEGSVRNANVRRYQDYEQRHIEVIATQALSSSEMLLSAKTRNSHIRFEHAVRTKLYGVDITQNNFVQSRASIAQTFTFAARCGQTFRIEKLAAICTSEPDGSHAIKKRALSLLQSIKDYAQLRAAHTGAWWQLWQQVVVDAAQEDIALALRFHAFHLLQTISEHSVAIDTGVPARGWHGEVYRGQIFWDELFVLPFYNYRFPSVSRAMLLYRFRRLPQAKQAAKKEGFGGAMYPWRSAYSGREVTPKRQKNLISGQWAKDPTHLQHHVGSAIACNVWRYYLSSGDYDFLRRFGAEMILEIARFWASIARYNVARERYDIEGVIGPDEYHNQYPHASQPGLKNNAYTNISAAWTLCRALQLKQCLRETDWQSLTQKLCLKAEEFQHWDHISRNLQVCFHNGGVISQFEGFDQLRAFDISQLPEKIRYERTDWAIAAQGEMVDEYQVTKQADTMVLFYLFSEAEIAELFKRLGYRYSRNILQRTADYYLPRSSHRSSLSQVVYAGALAYIDPSSSWQLFRRSLATDIHRLDSESTAEGIHLGAMGASLDILQRCYAGLTPLMRGLRVWPHVPEQLQYLQVAVEFRGQRLILELCPAGVKLASARGNDKSVLLITPQGEYTLEPSESHFVASQNGETD